MSNIEKARRVIDIEIMALERLKNKLDKEFSKVLEVIGQVNSSNGKLVVLGVGKSGNISRKIVSTFNSIGISAVNLNIQDAQHGDLGLLKNNDLVLALSYSGETPELLNLLPFILKRQIRLVSFTGNINSTLAKNSQITLDVGVEQEACPLNLAPTASSTAMLVLGDALAMVFAEEKNLTKEQFSEFHPAGTLGKFLLTKVKDIMRSNERLALVKETSTLIETLAIMSKARGGACAIVGENDQLVGIFTHGDFVRFFQSSQTDKKQAIIHYMTKKPIVLDEDELAEHALKLLKNHQIDEIIVVNQQKQPVGIIDTQDLAKFLYC